MDAKNLVVWALEASMYFDPRKPGLTPAELVELGAGFGVDADHVHYELRGRPTDAARVLPFAVDPSMFGTYAGDLRTLRAFDHVVSALNEAHRMAAGRDAWASREAIVATGEAAGVPRVDVEYAVAMYRAFDGAPGADDRWMLRRVKPAATLPSAQRSGPAGVKLTRRERYAELVEALRALVERRGGGMAGQTAPVTRQESAGQVTQHAAAGHAAPVAKHAAAAQATPDTKQSAPAPTHASAQEPPRAAPEADPVAAFGSILPALGQVRLVPWWNQLAREYRGASDASTALTRCLLAAWMTEGALTIACRRAGIPRPDPKATKPVRLTLTELARAATAMGLDGELRGRIERLSKTRQRVQSTRLFDETGAWSKLTAEDADEASATLDATLGVILAWQVRTPTVK